MERLKQMKEMLISCVQGQLSDLQNANTEELGEAIDMIKDLSEAIYHCTITKAMEDKEKEEEYMKKGIMSTPRYYQYPPIMYNEGGRRMYYDGRDGMNSRYMHDEEIYPYPSEIRDFREGKSPITRRNYMESKELKYGKEKQMHELEKYMKELTDDILEMIEGASPEEKMILSQKLSALSGKIQ